MFKIEDLAIAGLNCTVAIVIGIYCIRRFHSLAHTDHRYPKDAQFWTTPVNFVISTLLYVGLAIVVFVILSILPELVESLLAAFAPEAPEKVKQWIKNLGTEQYRRIATPILSTAAMAGLFMFEKSPLAFADRWIRRALQRVASIPTKVRATMVEIEGAEFALDAERRTQVLDHLSAILGNPFDESLLDNSDRDLVDWIWKTGSLDLAFDEWQTPETHFSELYSGNQDEMDELQSKFGALFRVAEPALALLKQQQSAGAMVASGARTTALKRDFAALFKEQLVPFTCAIVQSSNRVCKRCEYLERFGFYVLTLPNPHDVFAFMLEDFCALVFFLVLLVYPAVFGLAWVRGWRGDNTYLDFLLFWPAQLAAFAVAAALPAILLQRPRHVPSANLASGLKPRRFLAYLLIGTAGGVFSVLAIVLLGTASEIASPLVHGGTPHGLSDRFARALPYGPVAAIIGIVTAVLIDVPHRFRMRFVVDGLVTGVVAGILAFIAVMAQTNASIGSLGGVIRQDKTELLRNPDLRIVPFVVPLVFAMGFCTGLIIPRGFRRYSQGHAYQARSEQGQPRPVASV